MSTEHRTMFEQLAAQFHPSEVKSRSQAGRTFSYITARVAMNRLDEVLGPENWWDSYQPLDNSVLCQLTIRLPQPDGGWREVTKMDAGGYAGMSDQGDDDKSGFSDAFKRAAVKFGVGRYLYNDGVPIYPQEAAPPPAPEPHPPGLKNQHPNNSGYHNGQYASPKDTEAYLKRLKERVQAVNDQWQEHWVDPRTGEFPAPIKQELMSIYQADGHLTKWAVETGQLDPDALEKNGKAALLGRHAAILLTRGKSVAAAMKAELDRYCTQAFQDKKEAIYRKHPELAPDGYAEEQAEALGHGDAYEGEMAEAVAS